MPPLRFYYRVLRHGQTARYYASLSSARRSVRNRGGRIESWHGAAIGWCDAMDRDSLKVMRSLLKPVVPC